MTDSVAAIPREIAEEYEITIVPFHTIVDGKDYLDTTIDVKWLYARLKEKDNLPTTSFPSVGEFLQAYQSPAQSSEAILYISMTSAFTKGYEAAVEARGMAREKLPKTKIEVIDSYTLEAGELLLVIEAARAKTKKQIMNKMIGIAKERIGGRKLHAAIVHTNVLKQAEKLKEMLLSQCHCKELYISEAAAVSAVHNGEGLISFGFYSSD